MTRARTPSLFFAASALAAIPAQLAAQPGARAGQLLSAEPLAGAPAGARAWRIRYLTQEPRQGLREATGLVVAPNAAASAGARPVLAYAHGTWGTEPACAPSLSANVWSKTPGLEDALRRGYVVVATDYPGLGSAAPHGYLVGDSAGRAVLDSVRAAQAIADARAGRRFAVWGESQGGHAALFTGRLAARYAPELQLQGIAAAAPPTDLVQNLTAGTDPSVRAVLTAYVAASWSRYYGIDLATLGRPRTQSLIRRLAANCVTVGRAPSLGTVVGVAILRRDLKGVDLGRIAPWAGLARRNSTTPAPAAVPFLFAQAARDPIVAPAVTRSFARRLCAAGARVRWIDLPGRDHAATGADSAAATLDWIDARFAKAPPPNDCRRI